MNVENAVYPRGEQLTEAIQNGSNGPIVMVNLLKFKDRSSYKDGRADDATGREAYDRYAAEMLPFVKIAMSPDVAKFGVHREAGLAGQILIQCQQAAP